MIVETYQNMLVLRTLKSGEVYRPLPSVTMGRAYRCLTDMLGMNCELSLIHISEPTSH